MVVVLVVNLNSYSVYLLFIKSTVFIFLIVSRLNLILWILMLSLVWIEFYFCNKNAFYICNAHKYKTVAHSILFCFKSITSFDIVVVKRLLRNKNWCVVGWWMGASYSIHHLKHFISNFMSFLFQFIHVIYMTVVY